MRSKYLMTKDGKTTTKCSKSMRKKLCLIKLQIKPIITLTVQLSPPRRFVIVKTVLFREAAISMLLQKGATSILETLLKIMQWHAFLVTSQIIT